MQLFGKIFRGGFLLTMVAFCLGPQLSADSGEESFDFDPPVVRVPVYGETLSMLEQERADYARNLANYAANNVNENSASKSSLHLARRLLAVALHLSPRSKDPLVVSHQLEQSLIPKVRKMDYTPEVFARLLLSRAELLYKQEDPGERLLARSFIDLAAMIDPRNEDAVYAFQIQVIDHGALDWSEITDSKETASATVPAKE